MLIDILGSVAFILTMICILVPVKSLYEGVKKMEIKNMTLEYFLIGIFQATFGCIYGHKKNDFYNSLTNDFVVFLFLLYLNTFLYINHKTNQLIYYNLCIFSIIFLFFKIFPGEIALILTSVIATAWQLSTIRTIRKSLMEKDAAYINLLLATITIICALTWIIYNTLIQNYWLTIPSVAGVFFWGINLTIFYWTKGLIPDDNLFINLLKFIFMIGVEEKTKKLLDNLRTTSKDV